MDRLLKKIRSLKFECGWRCFGGLHSHGTPHCDYGGWGVGYSILPYSNRILWSLSFSSSVGVPNLQKVRVSEGVSSCILGTPFEENDSLLRLFKDPWLTYILRHTEMWIKCHSLGCFSQMGTGTFIHWRITCARALGNTESLGPQC